MILKKMCITNSIYLVKIKNYDLTIFIIILINILENKVWCNPGTSVNNWFIIFN